MVLPRDLIASEAGLGEWSVLTAYRGSIAHGTYVPNKDPNSIDDKDVIAVCVPPPDFYLGIDNYASRGTREIKIREWDIVVYEMRKLIGLLYKGNPNVLSLLWTPENKIIKSTNAGDYLREQRGLFVGKHVYHSFVGYAHGQLHRMTHMAFEGYMGEKRKGLVQRHGYDTKNASHLIRLLRMGIEFLTEGQLHVERVVDNNELIEIKLGEWKLERVKAEAERLFKLSEEAYVNSTLPNEPDRAAVSHLCTTLVRMAHNQRGEW